MFGPIDRLRMANCNIPRQFPGFYLQLQRRGRKGRNSLEKIGHAPVKTGAPYFRLVVDNKVRSKFVSAFLLQRVLAADRLFKSY
jgi:hypothetical protein